MDSAFYKFAILDLFDLCFFCQKLLVLPRFVSLSQHFFIPQIVFSLSSIGDRLIVQVFFLLSKSEIFRSGIELRIGI